MFCFFVWASEGKRNSVFFFVVVLCFVFAFVFFFVMCFFCVCFVFRVFSFLFFFEVFSFFVYHLQQNNYRFDVVQIYFFRIYINL